MRIHIKTFRGQEHPNSKITDEIVRKIRDLRQSGMTIRQIADQVSDIHYSSIARICRREAWKHL